MREIDELIRLWWLRYEGLTAHIDLAVDDQDIPLLLATRELEAHLKIGDQTSLDVMLRMIELARKDDEDNWLGYFWGPRHKFWRHASDTTKAIATAMACVNEDPHKVMHYPNHMFHRLCYKRATEK